MLGRRENVVTGTYCTDCVNMDNLAAIRNGSLDANGLRFEVHNPGPTAYTDTVTDRGAHKYAPAHTHPHLVHGTIRGYVHWNRI